MGVSNNPDSHRRAGIILIVAFILILVYGGYYYYVQKTDEAMAAKVYRELGAIDDKLDRLDIAAAGIIEQKSINASLASIIGNTTVDNFAANQRPILDLVRKLDYNPQLQNQFESIMSELWVSRNEPKLQKHEMKRLHVTMRELNYQYGKEVSAFNMQVAELSTAIAAVAEEIKHIRINKLHENDLAKLKFISNKLDKTAKSLRGTFYDNMVHDMLDTAASNMAPDIKESS